MSVSAPRTLLLAAASAIVLMPWCARAAIVNFRVECDDRNTLYTSTDDLLEGSSLSGHNWTNTGSFDLPVNTPTYLHVRGQEYGGGQWMAASFSAPFGYAFQETGSRTLVTTGDASKQAGRALWSASTVPWNDAAYVTWNPSVSPNPPSTGYGDPGGNFPAGTERIWKPGGAGDNEQVYFSTRATLAEVVTPIQGTPLASVGTAEGFSTQVVHTSTQWGNMDNIGEANAALNLRPGDAGYYVAQVGSVDRAHVDTAGQYSGEAGQLLPIERGNTATGEHYATRLSGYVYAPTDNYVRSFAVGSDDGFQLKIGDTLVNEVYGGGGVSAQQNTLPVVFPTAGYYPIEITWFQGGGGLGLEVSSREGEWRGADWNTTDFQILGSDPNFQIYQRPGGVPNPAELGGGRAGTPIYSGPVDTAKADGLRVQVLTKGSGWANIAETAQYLKDHPQDGAIVKSSVLDYGGGGNFSYNNPFPQDAAWNANNFGMRINGLVYIQTPGDYAIGVGTDDGFRIRIGGAPAGEYSGGRGIGGGWANYQSVHFEQPGLYPVEFYMNQGGGGYEVEISAGAHPGLIVPTKNPAALGLTADLSGMVFSVEPVARLTRVGASLKGEAAAYIPALDVSAPVESWVLQQKVEGAGPRTAGLVGQYYDYNGNGARWDDAAPLLGTRDDLTGGDAYFGDNYAYGPWGNTEDNFAARWTGYIEIPETGFYDFRMNTDDASWLFIDVDNDGTLDAAPGNDAWTVNWSGVELAAGMHAVELRAREWGGGENSRLEWMIPGAAGWQTIPAGFFAQGLYDGAYLPLAFGLNDQLGSLDFDELLANFDLDPDTVYSLRLVSTVAGLTAVAEGDFVFVPEPGSCLLLAFGALGLLLGRRRRSRR